MLIFDICEATDFVQNIFAQPRRPLVLVGDAMYGGYSFSLSALRQ